MAVKRRHAFIQFCDLPHCLACSYWKREKGNSDSGEDDEAEREFEAEGLDLGQDEVGTC